MKTELDLSFYDQRDCPSNYEEKIKSNSQVILKHYSTEKLQFI